MGYYLRIIIGMGLSMLVSTYLLQALFIDHTPTPFWDAFSGKMARLKQTSLLAQSSVLDYIQQTTSSLSSSAVRPTPLPTAPAPQQPTSSFSFFDVLPAPTAPLAPTTVPTATPVPTVYVKPTALPTLSILPTIPLNGPTDRPIPTVRPTIAPTVTPIPTKAPKPTVSVSFPKVVGDPLKQKWYGVGSLACYTTERFIQVYANGLTPNSCYNNIRAAIDSNIVSTTLLGRSVQVHKKALAAFEAVSKTLDQYKVDSSTYKFPSKTYKIKNVGAYIFRCNVNASTSAKGDTCSTGCKLSPHAFGIGVDINYDENCNGCKNYDMPKEISDTFEMYGFRWGGHYPLIGSYIDPMHFEYMRDLCDGV